MIRLILVLLFLLCYFIISIPVMLIELVVGLFSEKAKKNSTFRYVQWGFHCVLFLSGTKLTILGKEKIPTGEGVLYVGNHRSYFDIVCNYATVPSLTGFIAKKSVKKVPVLNLLMMNLDCLFLDRDDMRQGMQVILDAAEKVKQGTSICIYPEGTRNKTQEPLLPFKKGSFKIAQRSGGAIVPVVINNSRNIYEAHRPFIRKQHVVMEYLDPIYMKDLPKEEQKRINDYVADIIREKYLQNEELV